MTKKIWHLIGQLVRLGQPHNIVDDVEQSDWAALLAATGTTHQTLPPPSYEGAGPARLALYSINYGIVCIVLNTALLPAIEIIFFTVAHDATLHPKSSVLETG